MYLNDKLNYLNNFLGFQIEKNHNNFNLIRTFDALLTDFRKYLEMIVIK